MNKLCLKVSPNFPKNLEVCRLECFPFLNLSLIAIMPRLHYLVHHSYYCQDFKLLQTKYVVFFYKENPFLINESKGKFWGLFENPLSHFYI
jgi:hypothetical protein